MPINPEIIFENEKFLIIDKPAGLLSVRARGSLSKEKTAADWIKENFGDVFIVHRLDKETSGLMIFAKTADMQKKFSDMLEKRLIEKKYRALVWGHPDKKNGFIDKRIKEFSSGRCAIDFDGKDSFTEYKVEKEFEKTSLLTVSPKTGRRHQIRVHLYSLGHPLVGDRLYGNIAENKKYPRLMLRSFYLAFEIEGEKFSFSMIKDPSFESLLSLFN
ncbi:MAG: RNA pseudouridine synthase [Elusimicrobia bacterium]|nr:RNA pseudouridine synthase [Elusimicrobiota bacterium]